jgi:hypothetical protein
MASTLEELDREWSELATSPCARRALIRWANDHPALAGLRDLDEVLAARRDNSRAPALLAALAALAPTDELAARTLLQALVPGLARLSSLTGNDDPAAIDEMVSLAWERIRTYPTTRRGSVAGNVLLDVRKRYRRHRLVEVPASLELTGDPEDDGCTPEDEVLGRLLIEELAMATTNAGPPASSAEQEVIDRYIAFWDARLAANSGTPNPNDPALAEYATGDQLTAVVAETQENLNEGRAFRARPDPADFRQVTVVSVEGDQAVVQECFVDDGLVIERATGDVVNDTIATHNVRGELARVDGEWRVSSTRLVQRWEGVNGCARAS